MYAHDEASNGHASSNNYKMHIHIANVSRCTFAKLQRLHTPPHPRRQVRQDKKQQDEQRGKKSVEYGALCVGTACIEILSEMCRKRSYGGEDFLSLGLHRIEILGIHWTQVSSPTHECCILI